MRILVYGANGYLGSHLARHFVAQGHEVFGFVRSDDAAARLKAAGAEAVLGDLKDLGASVAQIGTINPDAVVYAAQLMLDEEREAVSAMLDALESSGKAFIFTSGTGVLSQRTDGDWSEDSFTEEDDFVPSKYIGARKLTEDLVRGAADRGVRAMVIRPPLIWGNGGCPTITNFYNSAAKTGSVCYVGRGLNLYSNVHVEDLARVYELALEKGVAGRLYHAVSGETNFRTLAQGVAETLGVPARSVSFSEALDVWDKFTALIGMSICSRSRSPLTRRELGWAPSPDRLDIMEETRHPAFRAQMESVAG
ncbi:NAD-dependent epimerase/dehydratase family protein [soil metagenome]